MDEPSKKRLKLCDNAQSAKKSHAG